MNSIIGSSSIQQNGLEVQHHHHYHQATPSKHDEQEIIRWRLYAAAGKWGLDAHSDDTSRSNDDDDDDDDDDDYYNKKFGFKHHYHVPDRNLLALQMQQHAHSFNSISIRNSNKNKQTAATLPPGEMLPRNEALGGFIFVCNNETMQEDLRRQLFGLPQKYKDSVRAITPGLPLFLYNYTCHQLHGVFQAVSFGGSNIDPTAWEDKKCRGESRFPAQVRMRIKQKCKALEEDAFRPILYHYDGPKFRLQLSVPEALALLDLFKEEDLLREETKNFY